MKLKEYKFILVLCIFLLIMLCGCDKQESTNENMNYLGGTGEFKTVLGMYGREAVYDDEYIYVYTDTYGYVAIPRDEKGEIYSICTDASCDHKNGKCKASGDNNYFAVDGKLYGITNLATDNNETESYIKECETGKTVFKNRIPEGIEEDKISKSNNYITYVIVLDDKYLKIACNEYTYIVDREFNVILYHENIGRVDWGAVFDNKYFYLNDLKKIVYIDLDTKTEYECDTVKWALTAGSDDKYIYYTDDMFALYRLSPNTGEKLKLAGNVALFSVYNGYIYFNIYGIMGAEDSDALNIIDCDGNLINKIEGIDNGFIVEADSKLYVINKKIYAIGTGNIMIADYDGNNVQIMDIKD